MSTTTEKATRWGLIGCGGCLGLAVVAVVGVVGFVLILFAGMKHSAAYQAAVGAAESSPAVQEALGTPITDSFFFIGNVSEDKEVAFGSNDGHEGDSPKQGTAHFDISISGPKGTGTVHYRAKLESGQWKAVEHSVSIDGTSQQIDLLKQ